MEICANGTIVRLYKNLYKLHNKFATVDDDVLQYLPYCRQNLLMISNWFYNYLFNQVVDFIFREKQIQLCDKKEFREKYLEFAEKFKIANLKFLEFFIAFFTPLYLCMRAKLQDLCVEDFSTSKKISIASKLIGDLYNLIALQLYGLDITCSVLKEPSICTDNKNLCASLCEQHGCEKCDKQVTNSIILFVNPKYYEAEGLFDEIVSSLGLIKDPSKVILFVDYTYCVPLHSDETYRWEETGAYERYQKAKQYVAAIYFINHSRVDFGKYRDELEPYIMKSYRQHKRLLDYWRKYKKPITLDKVKP